MRLPWSKPPQVPEAADGQLVSMCTILTFTLAPGHPMRAAPCVVCRKAIAGGPLMIAGVVAVGGQACSCGAASSEMFFAHAAHSRPGTRDLVPIIAAQLESGHEHDWDLVR